MTTQCLNPNASPALRLKMPDAEHDQLGRHLFVDQVTQLLQAIREPFVIALNAPWGSGKTFTLGLLEPALAKAGVTTLRFNAWEVDDATDPLVALVATVHDRLLQVKGYGASVTADKVERWRKAGVAVVKHGAIAAIKAATGGLLDPGELADGAAKAVAEAAQKAGESIAADVVDAFKRERQAAAEFKKLLSELIAFMRATASDGDPLPLVLVIDELDRCRPTFAVAMLERIKHFFEIPGLVFVLAVDLKQLEASTRNVYGADLDATEYLRRFVDLELALPRAPVNELVNGLFVASGLDALFEERAQAHTGMRFERRDLVEIITQLAWHYGLSLRLVQRMTTRLVLVMRPAHALGQLIDVVMLALMLFLRIRRADVLPQLTSGLAGVDDVRRWLSEIGPGGAAFWASSAGAKVEARQIVCSWPTAKGRFDEYQRLVSNAMRDLSRGINNDEATKRARRVTQAYDDIAHISAAFQPAALRKLAARIDLVAADLDQV